jgi:UDP-hydrolysing UDP-N-acetyl-D-glucosamine 2-epimerase
MRKICVVVTARPSYSRIKSLLYSVSERPDLELQLVVAGSALLERYGKVSEQMTVDGFHASAEVYNVLDGDNPLLMAKSTGLATMELATVFETLQPDVVITIGDRYETLGTAIAASYMNIFLAHIQGGEVTGSIDERVRHAVTKLSDVHFTATESAANNVIRMGEDPKSVYNTGCPSIDVVVQALNLDPSQGNLQALIDVRGVGHNINLSRPYIVVQHHPDTNTYERSSEEIQIVYEAVLESGIPAVWFWPNVDAGSETASGTLRKYREKFPNSPIRFIKNLPPEVFIRLINHANGIVGNSSVGIRECEFLGVPAINIGSRQMDRERGLNVIDVDYDVQQIASAIGSIGYSKVRAESQQLYGRGHSGRDIAQLLARIDLNRSKKLKFTV